MNSIQQDSQVARPGKVRRIRFWLLIFLAVVCFVLLPMFYLVDSPKPDDSFLDYQFTSVPASSNGLALLELAGEKATNGKLLDLVDEDDCELGIEEYTQEQRLLYLNSNEEALKLLDAAMAKKSIVQKPLIALSDRIVNIREQKNLVHLLSMRAQQRMLSGQVSAAMEDYLSMQKIAYFFIVDNTCLIQMFCGGALKTIGRELLMEQLLISEVSENQIKRFQEAFELTMIKPLHYKLGVCAEYQFTKAVVNGPEFKKAFTGNPFALIFYKPNRTRTFLSNYFETAVRDYTRPKELRQLPEIFDKFEKSCFDWKTQYGPNSFGVAIIAQLLPTLGIAARRIKDLCYADQATQVFLALHRYANIHGDLPTSLDLLVPDFIDALPLNAYGTDSLNYDYQKRQIRNANSNEEKNVYSVNFPHLSDSK